MEYLSISKKERTGFLILIGIVSSIWLLPRFFHKRDADKILIAKADSILATSSVESNLKTKTFSLFAFDPNTLDDKGWRNLGVTEKNLVTIRNYLSKGGRFRAASDIYRIYGLRTDISERLEPYIKIKGPDGIKHFSNPRVKTIQPFVYVHQGRAKFYKPPESVDINTADTTMLIALPGIGSKLAQRIVLFRDKCGGFYSVDQVAEVYGLKDSVFQLIKIRLKTGNGVLRLLHINTISADSLAKHPYVNYSEARAIVQYRQQHGTFKNAEDLLAIAIITSQWLEKLKPYLEFD
jgi:competence protein ComEA